jgi:zeta-carotene desaturase
LLTRAVLLLQGAPKLKVAIVGGGLAGLSTAVELLDQG